MPELRPHQLKIALVWPQIAPNTGNIARLCVATRTALHLVRPMGFVLGDRQLRRSAMDYWDRLNLTVHDDLTAFWSAVGRGQFWLMTSKGGNSLWDARFEDGDWLIFGNESAGLPELVTASRAERCLRIPQAPGERCLNLSTAAGIALYAALHAIQAGVGQNTIAGSLSQIAL